MGLFHSVANRALNAFGYTLERVRFQDPFAYLPDLGPVRTIIDVGVARGTPGLYRAYPNAYLILVEPNPIFHPVLQDFLRKSRAGELHTLAAGARSDRVMLTLAGTKSSLLERATLTTTTQGHEHREVEVQRLDDILTPEKLARPVLLKIDTEGYELETLRGLGQLSYSIDYVVLEASVVERFVGSYRLVDLIREMDSLGYSLARILAAPRDQEGLIKYADLLFCREPS
jgi:FkbM family methyltransferase